ncbi:MAG: helix-turn-helix domain-containing protein, partial [Eubacteriales bacterium]|nr:helix-turn-helix domain-containing protein [Eubacteriales bacterium]
GNVRELKNIVERLVIMSTAATITINEVPEGMLEAAKLAEHSGDRMLDEKERIERALALNHGHREMTARYLDISRRTLQYKLKKYGLN